MVDRNLSALHKVNFTEGSVEKFGKATLVVQISHEVLLITKENADCFRVSESIFIAIEISLLVEHC